MMNRSPDIMFMAEYIKNVLYFATVRQGKTLKNTVDTHYFSIDNELVYENYYSDFGPLNLGCVYKYCRILNEKIDLYLNKQTIVHYTSIEPKKKANSAFLLGCYGVLYLSLTPRDALKPLLIHGQNYRPFQDATQGDSAYTISIMDCLQAIKKARELGFFNFQDFNYEEYERLDRIQGGDLNWIVPGKFLAFIGPVDYSVSLYHPPEIYIDYFLENDVKIVIRLNKRMYDGNVFNNVGIVHYDLFFQDGSCPPRRILFKFLQISEEADCAIAVHCKAGLGRTGSLIGSYLIKHYKMTSHEAIGWMRICRPGSVIGHQQGWLEQLEPWLMKQGNIYRKHTCQDSEKLPYHEFGIYSIAEKTTKQQSVIFKKLPSPSPPLHKQSARMIHTRPQNLRIKEDNTFNEDVEEQREEYLASCDLTVKPTGPLKQLKGCVLKSTNDEETDLFTTTKKTALWKKYLCCGSCFKTLNDALFMLAVRCASVTPEKCNSYTLCRLFDLLDFNKAAEKEREWRMKFSSLRHNQKSPCRGDHYNVSKTNNAQCSSAAGEPKVARPTSRNTTKSTAPSDSTCIRGKIPVATFRTTQAPIAKSVNEAKNCLMRGLYATEKEKHLTSSITVTPQTRAMSYLSTPTANNTRFSPQLYNATPKVQPVPSYRRRLGRSPSPPARISNDQSRATNTPSPTDKFLVKDASKSAFKDVLARLKSVATSRDGSLGASSLGANRNAPVPRRAPSVRSDERPLATQGDMLNSIKFQRRLRETIATDKTGFQNCMKSNVKPVNPRPNILSKPTYGPSPSQVTNNREKPSVMLRNFFGPQRPVSPKGRRNTPTSFY